MADLFAVVIYTRKERKLADYRSWLADLPIRFFSIEDMVGDAFPSIEDADGLEATAVRRATEVSRSLGMVTLAEAWGLEVDALGGRPGMRLDSLAQERATDAENNAALLGALEEVEDGERAARFRCVLALANPWREGRVSTAEGRCEGSIARTPRGGGGFGYDPLFIVTELGDRAMAELSDDERREVSPRARAVRALRAELVGLLDGILEHTDRVAG